MLHHKRKNLQLIFQCSFYILKSIFTQLKKILHNIKKLFQFNLFALTKIYVDLSFRYYLCTIEITNLNS